MRDEPNVWAKVPNSALSTDPMKGVGSYRQFEDGHGSRQSPRSA